MALTCSDRSFSAYPSDRPKTFAASLSVAERAEVTFAQFVMLTPFPGTLDYAAWEKALGPHPPRVGDIPVSRHWLIPQHHRPKCTWSTR
jgi:hypothetical protein